MKKTLLFMIVIAAFTIVGCSSKTTYEVVFEGNGGIYVGGGPLTQEIENGDSAVEPVFERYGYEFIGWTYDFENVHSDLTIVPIWQKIIFSGTEIYQIANPATVEISTFNKQNEQLGIGSGFFHNSNGEIITNYHVIEGAYSATVKMNTEDVFDVISVVGYSVDLDIAILKVNYMTSLYLKTSSRVQQTGDTVYAIGSSLGLSDTFTSGNISNVSRIIEEVDYFQITAPISPGNSGGPLLNEFGEVIGINTSIIPSGENIGFAIKISEVAKIDCSNPKAMADVFDENYIPRPFDNMANESESNSNLAYADIVVNGSTISGELASKADLDYFKIELTGPAKLTIVLFPYYEVDLDYLIVTIRNSLGQAIVYGEIGSYGEYSVIFVEHSFISAQTVYIGLSLLNTYPYTESSPYAVFIFSEYE